MVNISKESILYEIETKINDAKKEKVNLLSIDKNHPQIAIVDGKINSLVLIKSELIKINKSNEYHLTKQQEIVELAKMAKTREENIKTYTDAKREDLLKQEKIELDTLNEFLPKMPTTEELKTFISNKIDEYLTTQPNDYILSMKDMGKIKPIINAVYNTVDGGLIREVLLTKIK